MVVYYCNISISSTLEYVIGFNISTLANLITMGWLQVAKTAGTTCVPGALV